MASTPPMRIEGNRELLRAMQLMADELAPASRDGEKRVADRFLVSVGREASETAESRAATALSVFHEDHPVVGFAPGTAAGVSGGASMSEFFFGWEYGGARTATTQQFPASTQGFVRPVIKGEGDELAMLWFDEVTDELTRIWNRQAIKART